MALQKLWSEPSTGLQFANAYHRINGITLDYVAKQATFVALVYRDKAARDAGLNPFATRSFGVRNLSAQETANEQPNPEFDDLFSTTVLDAANKNPLEQAYLWLKKHPLYSGATDV